jgi:hypothetical protein
MGLERGDDAGESKGEAGCTLRFSMAWDWGTPDSSIVGEGKVKLGSGVSCPFPSPLPLPAVPLGCSNASKSSRSPFINAFRAALYRLLRAHKLPRTTTPTYAAYRPTIPPDSGSVRRPSCSDHMRMRTAMRKNVTSRMNAVLGTWNGRIRAIVPTTMETTAGFSRAPRCIGSGLDQGARAEDADEEGHADADANAKQCTH